MNQQLIEDEGSTNPMDRHQLSDRMSNWITGQEWKVDVLQAGDKIVGYTVYKVMTDNQGVKPTQVYIRQLFIGRDHRSRGYGAQALEVLSQTRFPTECQVKIDVLASNPRGHQFWTRVGFETYAIIMMRQPARQSTVNED